MKNKVFNRVLASIMVMITALSQCGCSDILSMNNHNSSNVESAGLQDKDSPQLIPIDDKQPEKETDIDFTPLQSAETEHKEELPNETASEGPKQTLEGAYSQIVRELESEYGEAKIESYNQNEIYYIDGCYFDLVDFNNDGCEELLAVVYAPTGDKTPYASDYRVKVYAYNNDNAECIFDHQGLHDYPDGDISDIFATVDIVTYEGKKYLVLSDFDTYSMESLYMTYKDNEFVSVKSIAYDGSVFDDDHQCYIDGKEVNEDEYSAELDRIHEDYKYYYLSEMQKDRVELSFKPIKNVKNRLFDENEQSNSYSEKDLLQKIKEFAKDEIEGEPVVADFDGDGNIEMVCQSGRQTSGPDFDMWQLYFIYTNGETVYEFGEVEDACLYEVETFVIPLKNGCHFAASSRWRNAVLQGAISYAEIYGLDALGADKYLNEGFRYLNNPGFETIDMEYYDVGPGNQLMSAYRMKWNGNNEYWNEDSLL